MSGLRRLDLSPWLITKLPFSPEHLYNKETGSNLLALFCKSVLGPLGGYPRCWKTWKKEVGNLGRRADMMDCWKICKKLCLDNIHKEPVWIKSDHPVQCCIKQCLPRPCNPRSNLRCPMFLWQLEKKFLSFKVWSVNMWDLVSIQLRVVLFQVGHAVKRGTFSLVSEKGCFSNWSVKRGTFHIS